MNQDAVKKLILKTAKKEGLAFDFCEALENNSTYQTDDWPSTADFDDDLSDDDSGDGWEKYSIKFLEMVPAKHFAECELALQEVIEMNDRDDFDELMDDEDIEYNGPEISPNATLSQIITQLKKADAFELISLVEKINESRASAKVIPAHGSRQAVMKALQGLDKETILEAIFQECSQFISSPDDLNKCKTVLDLIFFVEDQADSDLWEDVVDTLKLNKYKIPKARFDRDTEEQEWLPVFLKVRDHFDYDDLYHAVESCMENRE